MSNNKSLLREFGEYLIKRKAWWFAPLLILFLLIGILIVLSQTSALSPFIYALF